MKLINILLFTSILIVSCQSNTGSRQNNTEKSIAYKLATLEKGGYVSEDDLLVKRFDNLLQQVDNKYAVNKQQIGDMTYKIKEVAKERGIEVSMITVMEGAIQIGNINYATYLGSYLTLLEKGYTHDAILESIKLLY